MVVGPLRIVIGLAVIVLPLVAVADKTDEDAKMQFQQGVELYKEGSFDQAAVAFGRAYELKPNYKILFNIAQTENELRHYAAALQAYVRYLAEGGAEVSKDRLEVVRSEIKRLNALVGSIVMDCAVAGATVVVDRVEHGQTPLSGPIFVDLGTHDVVVEKAGSRLLERQVKVAGGEHVTVKVEGASGAAPPAAEPSAQPLPEAGRSSETPEN